MTAEQEQTDTLDLLDYLKDFSQFEDYQELSNQHVYEYYDTLDNYLEA